MKASKLVLLTLTALILSSGSCNSQNKKTAKTEEQESKEFRLPTIPMALNTNEDRANFLANNYWEHFDFKDLTQIDKSEVVEPIFADFAMVLGYSSHPNQTSGINKLLDKALAGDSLMFAHFVDMSEKYFADPNSPIRNEELFIPVLKYIIASPNVSELNKVRPMYQLEMAMKNRVTEIANDFKFTTKSGENSSMHNINAEYTMLYFNNPGCQDCKRVKQVISNSLIFTDLLRKNASGSSPLVILAIYSDNDLDSWKKEAYPDSWLNAYDEKGIIKKEDLYDLKAMPTIYLLDKAKRIILKDAPIEQIEEWLAENVK